MLDQVFGVPAHPLLVHIPVVFIPLTLLVAIVAVAWARGRKVLSLVVLGCATVGMLFAQLAVMSGESLEERVREDSLVHQHAELGEGTRTFAILVFLVAVAFVVREWRGGLRVRLAERAGTLLAPRRIGLAISVALIAVSALTTVWVVRTGHVGAKAVWNERTLNAGEGGQGGGGDSD
jgi:uncharacterized membrane protein